MTTWLTRIVPDPRNPLARADLADCVRMHQRVMLLVPDGLGEHAREQAGVLYRVEETRRGVHVLVQSALPPDLTRLPPGYGHADTRDLTPLLSWLRPGTLVRYRIAANTSKRASKSGKLTALRGTAAEEWWHARAARAGLALQSAAARPLSDTTGKASQDRTIRHAVTRFDGTAAITAPTAARQAIISGIGRGRAHGCGMLSIAPVLT